ncbi:hypothetical protein DEM27_13800 [Metarhizobium album]|uniref:NAD glycohydrolase translocation F5/8 type C domain-containing protein n=1 Tax=Metarhizobium album TaxID=2182425 RepID=A0A2U2DR03_9HYPH|nr:hypothetical protein [Rhizobium album]PWE55746.1 hypothetical protein DEM27_13800 [Rhizobium album]
MLGDFSMNGRIFAGTLALLVMASPAAAAGEPGVQQMPHASTEQRQPERRIERDMPEDLEPDMPEEVEPVFATRPVTGGEICQRQRFTIGEATVCVSSILEPQFGNRYGSLNLTDGRKSTAWVEGASGDGIGEYVAVEFDAPVIVSGLEIANGYTKNSDIFDKNNRVRNLTVSTASGSAQTVELTDNEDWQNLGVSLPEKTTWLMLTISSVYRGSKYRDTAISGLDIR